MIPSVVSPHSAFHTYTQQKALDCLAYHLLDDGELDNPRDRTPDLCAQEYWLRSLYIRKYHHSIPDPKHYHFMGRLCLCAFTSLLVKKSLSDHMYIVMQRCMDSLDSGLGVPTRQAHPHRIDNKRRHNILIPKIPEHALTEGMRMDKRRAVDYSDL